VNNLRAVLLFVLLCGLLLAAGYFIAGQSGLIAALVLAIALIAVSYWFSDKVALAMIGAKEVEPADEPRLHAIVEEVASVARLPKPRVYIVPNDSPNAFATGRNSAHAAVGVTSGALRFLDDRELTAVVGHEFGHIQNHDTLTNAVVAAAAGTIMFVAMMGRWTTFFGAFGSRGSTSGLVGLVAWPAMVLFSPLAAALARLAVSRGREYGADKAAIGLTHMPLALAGALEKLEAHSLLRPLPMNPGVAHMFIVNPLGSVSLSTMFTTHPPVKDRIKRLQETAGLTEMHA